MTILNERLHATVSGDVQGVGFRYFVQQAAFGLGLVGWVRNRSSGAVEVSAEGPRPALETFLGELRSGPRHAYVSGLDFTWQAATGEFENFQIGSTL